ncbi:MAG TPA: 2-succinyl-6-hydroxy-2,4-cyclohexadiene-1-carboxylate synthase [Nitrososphaerales archaeon]|nr:2-succinyl-6-hydroxy-2,4-cyclohexadiene-1-carboxylate synthase [Nitrososphaerales archaeon]
MPEVWFETQGDQVRDPVVLLHGFTGTHRTWMKLRASLSPRHSVIVADLPGHGNTPAPQHPSEMGVSPTADSIARIIRTQTGKQVALLGYSLGGRVALDLACRHQELLNCLILEGASPGLERDEERQTRRAEDEALADEIEEKGLRWFVDYWEATDIMATQKELSRQAFEEVRRERLSNTAKGLSMSLRAAGPGAMTSLWSAIEGIRIPVLLVVGKRDAKFSQIARAMQKKIQGSVVAEVEEAGHCVHVEKPDRFVEVVENFLADRPRSTGAAG